MRRLIVLLLALGACDPPGVAHVEGGIVATGATREERLDKALVAVDKSTFHPDLTKALERRKGTVMADAPDKLSGLPDGVAVVPMLDDKGLRTLWWGTDEEAVSKKLMEMGVEYVVLHREVEPSVDRGKWVASRLYHDDYREHFVLMSADADHLVYAVEKPISFPQPLAVFITTRLRAIMRGEPVPDFPKMDPPRGTKWNLVATVRKATGGREMAVGMCFREELGRCVVELAEDLEREHRRYMEWYGFPKLRDDVDNLIVEIHLVTERSLILTDDEDDLTRLWELGIDGAVIIDRTIDKAGVLPGAVSYTRSYNDVDKLLRETAEQAFLNSKRPWREEGNTLEKMRTIHYMDWPGQGFFPLFRGVAPVPLDAVDLEAIRRSIVLSGEWYIRNLAPFDLPLPYEPGQVTYKMWPSDNRYSDEYNIVRHTLATWNLVQAWHLDPRPEFLEGAERALNYTLRFRVDEGNTSFIEHDNNRKLGSVVVGLLGMIDLARAKNSREWDDLIIRFGEFTLKMQEPSGRFDPYYVPEDHPYADEKNDIVPGEAALALVNLYEYTGDKRWLEPLPKFLEYYEGWWNERVKQKNGSSPWPEYTYANLTRLDLVQFGPWSVMAANAYHKATGDEHFARFGLEVARWMIETYQWSSERAPWPDYVGGYYKMPNELPAMQAFCYAEGTAAAYALALRYKPEEAPFFEKATREAVRIALQMQFDDRQLYPFTRGDEVRGGTRYALNETKVRIDYVYHAQSSLWQYLTAAESDPNLPPEVRASRTRQLLEAVDNRLPLVPSGATPPEPPK